MIWILCALTFLLFTLPFLRGSKGNAWLISSTFLAGGLALALYTLLGNPSKKDVPLGFIKLPHEQMISSYNVLFQKIQRDRKNPSLWRKLCYSYARDKRVVESLSCFEELEKLSKLEDTDKETIKKLTALAEKQ